MPRFIPPTRRRRVNPFFVIIGFGVLIMAVGVAMEIRAASIASRCREAGYPDARVNFGGLGAGYCVKRVDQTDVVVPVDRL